MIDNQLTDFLEKMTTDSSTEILPKTFEQEPLAFMIGNKQFGFYEQCEEEMDARHNLIVKESFLDSVKRFTLDDVSPSLWKDKILKFHDCNLT